LRIDGTRGRDRRWDRRRDRDWGKCKAMHGRASEERKRSRHMWTVPTRAIVAATADGSSSSTLSSSDSFCKVWFFKVWFFFFFFLFGFDFFFLDCLVAEKFSCLGLEVIWDVQ
jgi:hypothetical protein